MVPVRVVLNTAMDKLPENLITHSVAVLKNDGYITVIQKTD